MFLMWLTLTFWPEKHIDFRTSKLHAILAFNHVLRMITWRKFPLLCSCKLRVLLRAQKQREKKYEVSVTQKTTRVAFLLKVFNRCNSAFLPLSLWVSMGLDVCASVWKGTFNCRSAGKEARCKGMSACQYSRCLKAACRSQIRCTFLFL